MIPRSEFPISSRHRARRVLSSVCGPRRHGHPLHLANNWTCTLVLCDTVRCQAARFRDTGRLRASGCDGNMGQGQNLALSCVTRRSQETGGDPASPTQGEHAASFSWASFPQLQVRKKVACSPPGHTTAVSLTPRKGPTLWRATCMSQSLGSRSRVMMISCCRVGLVSPTRKVPAKNEGTGLSPPRRPDTDMFTTYASAALAYGLPATTPLSLGFGGSSF